MSALPLCACIGATDQGTLCAQRPAFGSRGINLAGREGRAFIAHAQIFARKDTLRHRSDGRVPDGRGAFVRGYGSSFRGQDVRSMGRVPISQTRRICATACQGSDRACAALICIADKGKSVCRRKKQGCERKKTGCGASAYAYEGFSQAYVRFFHAYEGIFQACKILWEG